MAIDSNSYYLEEWERQFYLSELMKKYPEIDYKTMDDYQIMNLWEDEGE